MVAKMPDAGLFRGNVEEFDAFHFPEGATSQDVNALVDWIAQRSLLSVAQSVDERAFELLQESTLYFGTGTLTIKDRFVRLNVERNSVVLYNRQTAAFQVVDGKEVGNVGFFVGEQVGSESGILVPKACVDAIDGLSDGRAWASVESARIAIINAVIQAYKGEPHDE